MDREPSKTVRSGNGQACSLAISISGLVLDSRQDSEGPHDTVPRLRMLSECYTACPACAPPFCALNLNEGSVHLYFKHCRTNRRIHHPDTGFKSASSCTNAQYSPTSVRAPQRSTASVCSSVFSSEEYRYFLSHLNLTTLASSSSAPAL